MSKPLAILLSVMAAVALWFVAGKPMPSHDGPPVSRSGCTLDFGQDC